LEPFLRQEGDFFQEIIAQAHFIVKLVVGYLKHINIPILQYEPMAWRICMLNVTNGNTTKAFKVIKN